jgi:hypothetical protein
MSRLLRVGDKVINLDNIEYITREESSVVRIHFVHRDIELWNEQGEAFRQWVLSNAGYCEGSGEGWRSRNHRDGAFRLRPLYTVLGRAFLTPLLAWSRSSYPTSSVALRFTPLKRCSGAFVVRPCLPPVGRAHSFPNAMLTVTPCSAHRLLS